MKRDATDYMAYRVRALPALIETTERKLAGLYREASRYRMADILKNPASVCEAWDREVLVARILAADRGEPTGLVDVAMTEGFKS